MKRLKKIAFQALEIFLVFVCIFLTIILWPIIEFHNRVTKPRGMWL